MPARKTAIVTPPVASTELVKVRSQGFQLTSPLRPLVDTLEIVDSDTYLAADALVGRIRNARAVWKSKIDPILLPLKRVLDDAKAALGGAKALNEEVDTPLLELEMSVKGKMRDYKLLEARQMLIAREEEERKAAALIAEQQILARKETEAKTAQMKARLAQRRMDLEAQVVDVEGRIEDIQPIKGASSSSRTVKKCRIVNLGALVRSMEAYEPRAGVYKNEHPPLALINPEMLQVALNRIFASQPGVVETWPGIEIFDDVIIAGR